MFSVNTFSFVVSSLSSHADTGSLTFHQVRYSLSSATSFTVADKAQGFEAFYTTLYDLLLHPDEQTDVKELLNWWNMWVTAVVFVLRLSLLRRKLYPECLEYFPTENSTRNAFGSPTS